VEFYSKNKFEKLVCLVGFNIRIYHEIPPDPARKLSANFYDIYHCCVNSEKLLMMDRGTVRNMWSFIPKINFEKLVYLVGFNIGIYHEFRPDPARKLSANCMTYTIAVCQ